MAPPKGRNYPFSSRNPASWSNCHVSYEQAVEMFYNQTATQQHMGHNPIVQSKVFRGIEYSTIEEAQEVSTKTLNAEYLAREQRNLADENRGCTISKKFNDSIRNRIIPTENGLESPLSHRTPFAQSSDFSLAQLNTVMPSRNFQDPQLMQCTTGQSLDLSNSKISTDTFTQIDLSPTLGLSRENNNIIHDGIFVWTETKGSGHSFISIHNNLSVTVFTYGRFDDVGFMGLVGDGVLIKMTDRKAIEYCETELYKLEAKVFKIMDVEKDTVMSIYNTLWSSSDEVPDKKPNPDGRVIDRYDVTGNNCTTHTVEGLRKAGSDVFESDYTIPLSLEKHLIDQSNSFDMTVINVTKNMKKEIKNTAHHTPIDSMGRSGETQESATNSLSILGGSSTKSGATYNGSLGVFDEK